MPLNKDVISKPAIYEIVQNVSKVQFLTSAGPVYGFTKDQLRFAVDEVLMVCDFHSEPKATIAASPMLADVLDLLVQLKDYMDARADVEDGDYGVPRPNVELGFSADIESQIVALQQHIG